MLEKRQFWRVDRQRDYFLFLIFTSIFPFSVSIKMENRCSCSNFYFPFSVKARNGIYVGPVTLVTFSLVQAMWMSLNSNLTLNQGCRTAGAAIENRRCQEIELYEIVTFYVNVISLILVKLVNKTAAAASWKIEKFINCVTLCLYLRNGAIQGHSYYETLI